MILTGGGGAHTDFDSEDFFDAKSLFQELEGVQ